jgi:hypothetical protein
MRKWDEHANYAGYLNGVPQRRVYISIELQQTRKGLAIARWAPIPFEQPHLDGERLVAGTRAVSAALSPGAG